MCPRSSARFWCLGSSCSDLSEFPVFLASSATLPNLKIPEDRVCTLSAVLKLLAADVLWFVSDEGLNSLALTVFVLHFLEGLTIFVSQTYNPDKHPCKLPVPFDPLLA